MDMILTLRAEDGKLTYDLRTLEGELIIDPSRPEVAPAGAAIAAMRIAHSFIGMCLSGNS